MGEIKKGDVVQLKSGGPQMTVSDLNIGNDRKVECTWFDGKKVDKGYFPEEILVVVTGGGGIHIA